MDKLTAQVAVEAMINHPDGYDRLTVLSVLEVARRVGVSDFYLSMLVKAHPTLSASDVRRFQS